jgi:hypothetical protein
MPELADIFRAYGGRYLEQFSERMLPSHRRALADITACRTEVFGGQVTECVRCGYRHHVYHSCRNRSCPKCHATDSGRWLESRQAELLPVPYCHAIFTLPEELRDPVRSRQKTLYGALMTAAAESLQQLAADPHYVGGKIGILAVLHTWGKAMVHHPHVHCLIPAGGLAENGEWLPARKTYLLPVKALSRIFRAKFVALARKAHPEMFLPESIWQKDWVVYCKPAVQGAPKVLNYLARYVHRVAITNHRIVAVSDQQITFTCKDSRTQRWAPVGLKPEEFIRRFLQHVLPKGFNKVRYYGLLSPTHRKVLKRVQLLLDEPAMVDQPTSSDAESSDSFIECAPRQCPLCPTGIMVVIGRLPRQPRAPP